MSGTRELPDPLVGTVVAGRYRIDARLAAGGMGVVYDATQLGLGRRVALKVIRGDAVNDPIARLRFEREAKTASSLSEPHSVVVHDFGVLNEGDVGGGAGGLFIAMEFVEGETLRQLLGSTGRLTWKRTLVVVEHVALALAAAHGKGLVHRDLKPENIMLQAASGEGGGYFCKVLDFGLAKGVNEDLLRATDGKPLTRSGGFVGTPGYISPEHIDGAGEDPRQDVYALGVVWWEMLTGRHPFPAETPMKTLLRQMHEEPPPLDDVLRLADGIPPAGAQLVREMMARSPKDRPRDGAAVLARLQMLDNAPGTESGKLIDSNAPTLQGSRPPAMSPHPSPASLLGPDVPLIMSPHQDTRSSGVTTRDERPTSRPAPPSSPSTPASSPPTSSPPTSSPTTSLASTTSQTPELQSIRPRRSQKRLMAMLLGTSVVGTLAGAVIIKVLDEEPTPTPPPLPPVVVDAGVMSFTDIVVDGLPSFAALKPVRDLVPAHALKLYRPNHSELQVDGDVAATVADVLGGRVVDVGGVHYALEVRELDRGRVVVAASVFVDAGSVVDAGAENVDAGAAEVADAGVDVVPGGLEP